MGHPRAATHAGHLSERFIFGIYFGCIKQSPKYRTLNTILKLGYTISNGHTP